MIRKVQFVVFILEWHFNTFISVVSLPNPSRFGLLSCSQSSPQGFETSEFVGGQKVQLFETSRLWIGPSFWNPCESIHPWGLFRPNSLPFACFFEALWNWTEFVSGGDSVVQSSRDSSWGKPIFNSSWRLVSWLHLCRDDQRQTTISWRFRNWWTFQNLQVGWISSILIWSLATHSLTSFFKEWWELLTNKSGQESFPCLTLRENFLNGHVA